EENAVVNTLTTGEADGAYLDTASAAVPLLRDDTVQVFQGPSTNVWSLITTERGGLADPRLRRALSLALERDGIARAAFGGMAEPWSAPLGPGGWGYETDRFQQAYDGLRGAPADPGEADLAEARDLVREAGAPDEPIVVASDGEPARTVIANAVVDAAGKIGLQARIATVPRQQFGSYYVDADLREEVDLFSDEYWISKNDPVGFYKNGASDAGVNFSGFADDGYDRLVKQAQSATDDAERAELAVELQDRWTEAMPWIPVVQTPTTLAMRSEITGAPASAAFMSYPWAADLGAGEESGRCSDTCCAGSPACCSPWRPPRCSSAARCTPPPATRCRSWSATRRTSPRSGSRRCAPSTTWTSRCSCSTGCGRAGCSPATSAPPTKIGRASCRERGWIQEGGEASKEIRRKQ